MKSVAVMKFVARAMLYRASDVATFLRHGTGDLGEPSLERPVSQLATQGQCESPVYRAWCMRMKHDPDARTHPYNRKLWEWVYILEVLNQRGLLAEGTRGLGFGVGSEPLTAVMADAGCRIVATDLPVEDAKSAGWAASDQHASNLDALNGREICDNERFRRAVTYRAMDMTRIDPDLKDFDFVWSSCSLEHLGSLEAGVRFVENSLCCLKPGGVAVHTTEYNVLSNTRTLTGGATVLYRKRDIFALADRLRNAGHQITLNLNSGRGEIDTYYDVPPYYQQGPHLKLVLGEFVTTSIGLIITRSTVPLS